MGNGERRVVCTPGTCGGAPRINGTRLTCSNIVFGLCRTKGDIRAYLEPYPDLTQEDVVSALQYCAGRRCMKDRPARYCQGCSLDETDADFPSLFIENDESLRAYVNSDEGDLAFLGSVEEFFEDQKPVDVWNVSSRFLTTL